SLGVLIDLLLRGSFLVAWRILAGRLIVGRRRFLAGGFLVSGLFGGALLVGRALTGGCLVDDDDDLADGGLVTGLDANVCHAPAYRRRHLDGGLVGFELHDRLVFLDHVTR